MAPGRDPGPPVCRSLPVPGLLGLLLVLSQSGCALWQPAAEPLAAAPLELTATPFYPQRDYQCGPAALATVLGASGVEVHPDELTEALYLPERHGTLQVELMAAARRRGRLAVRLDGAGQSGLQAIVSQLAAGRPVLVLQNLASRLVPVWHYAVVVGYLPGEDRFVLRSGAEPRVLVGRRRFAATWDRADDWALVLLRPGEVPRDVASRAYLQAAAELESTGSYTLALESFRSAAAAWPGDPTAALGVANSLYYLGRRAEAASAYQDLLNDHPGALVAAHNLVNVELELGRVCRARRTLERYQAGGHASAADDAGQALLQSAREAVASATARLADSARARCADPDTQTTGDSP